MPIHLTGEKLWVWAGTKQGFRHQVEAYATEGGEGDLPGFLATLIVRPKMALARTDEEKAVLKDGIYRRSTLWALGVKETGLIFTKLDSSYRRSPAKFEGLVLKPAQVTNPAHFDAGKLLTRQIDIATFPICRVGARVVQMPDGWYALWGEATGPFPSRKATQVALTVISGVDSTD